MASVESSESGRSQTEAGSIIIFRATLRYYPNQRRREDLWSQYLSSAHRTPEGRPLGDGKGLESGIADYFENRIREFFPGALRESFRSYLLRIYPPVPVANLLAGG
jgi:hypothetical protein